MKTRAALLAAALAAALVPVRPAFVERGYSSLFYPRLQQALTPLVNLLPIAILDLAAAVSVAALALILIRRARRSGWRRALLRTTGTLVSAAAIGYLLFLVLWGLNYRRVPLEEKLDYDSARVTIGAAAQLGDVSAVALNRGFAAAHRQVWSPASLAASFTASLGQLKGPVGTVPGVPKSSLLTFYFRQAAIDGMTDPFFLEIIVNPDVLDVERPFVVAHEWAHLAGYADEAEANFVAWLTCLHGDALAQYSGWLAAYEEAMGRLPPGRRTQVTRLGEGPAADLRAMAARYRRSSPVVREAAREIYDGYLRANRVADGIDSYDAVLRLMIGTRFGPGWTPGMR